MGYYSHGYEGKRRKGPGEMIMRVIFVAVLIFLFNRWFLSRGTTPSTPQSSPGNPPAATADDPRQAEIRQALQPATRPAPVEGIAVVILVDTSGSMKDRVRGPDGKSVIKMDAAKKAVHELIDTTARLKAERLKLPVLLGVYEFSARNDPPSVRPVVPLGDLDPAKARAAVERMQPEGGTPIGDGIVHAKRDLDQTGMTRQHILVVTDGANTSGHPPEAVLQAMNAATEGIPASTYFVAFDIDANLFKPVKDQGVAVLPAADAQALRTTLDQVLTERILVE